MEIKTDASRKDYFDFLKYYHFKRNMGLRVGVPFCVILLISFNLTYREGHYFLSQFLFISLSLSLLFFLLFFLLPYFISIIKVSKIFKNAPAEVNNFILYEEGIDIESSNTNKYYSWKDIRYIEKFHSHLFIKLYHNRFYLFPQTSFQSDRDKDIFFNTVHPQIQKNKYQNVNRLYNKGWLGLIPLVGFFTGIWLISEGINKYKDRKLIFIGVASMMFTVIIYSSMFYYAKYSKQFRKDYAPFSKMDLNNLIRDVEFYKSQKGYYPDSLTELFFIDKMVIIDDPIQQDNNQNKGKFYYKKLGEKYTLFSCGVDKTPFTADDIFPSMEGLDSSKIGFIRDR